MSSEEQISEDERLRLRGFGVEENQWVGARILKQDPPPGGLLPAVERACRMAKNSFGARDPIYAEALINCALYYDLVENDAGKAAPYFAEARSVLGENSVEMATGLYFLGLFHFQTRHDVERGERSITEALAMFKQCLGENSRPVADCHSILAQMRQQ
jgi:hypothetical protein